jgi:hypothetical protein
MIILLFIFNINQAVQGNPPDTIKIQKQSFLEKLSFGIGYSRGLCWTGDNLTKANAAPLDVSAKLYWLNSIEGSITLPFNMDWNVGILGGYLWSPELKDREGVRHIITSDVNLDAIKLSLSFEMKHTFFTGISFYFFRALMEEYTYTHSGDTIAYVKRKCIGGDLFCGWKGSSMFGFSQLKPYLKLQFGWAKEYSNNSPWEWDDGLTVGLSGVFIGVKFEIGDY